jgi:glycosyltransferase involved in cell wall biosynthesis
VQVHVLVARVEDDAHIDGVTVHQSAALFNSEASIGVRLGDVLSCEPDLVHLHQVDDPGIADALQGHAPVVISAHGYTLCTAGVYYFQPGNECTRAHGPGCLPNLLLRGCAHSRFPKRIPVKYRNATAALGALRRADLVVSYSTSVDRHLTANEITRRTIVPYFPTMGQKSGSGHRTRRRVVFAGRVVAPKGVAVLVRAAREVDAEFVVCGDGPLLERMRRLARRLGVDQRVVFRGWLDQDRLAEELANASVVAVPSVWPEPFGLVGIEGLASGRPAVASATGGIGDWLEDGVSGLCVPPGDPRSLARALNELLADPERQTAMGAAGRESVARRFSPDRHLSRLLEGYRDAQAHWHAHSPVAA